MLVFCVHFYPVYSCVRSQFNAILAVKRKHKTKAKDSAENQLGDQAMIHHARAHSLCKGKRPHYNAYATWYNSTGVDVNV